MPQKQTRKLEVKRMFEPGRLSQIHLEKAYEQIIPKRIQVIQTHQDRRVTITNEHDTLVRRKIR